MYLTPFLSIFLLARSLPSLLLPSPLSCLLLSLPHLDGALADDVTLADVKRMDFHLRQSLQHLLDFFDLEAPHNSSSSSSSSSNPGGVSIDDRTLQGAGGGVGEISAAAPQAQTLGPNAPGTCLDVFPPLLKEK